MITELEAEVIDFDWFCIDSQDHIAHFTTGGMGFLPASVMASKHDLELVAAFFESLAPTGPAIVSSDLLKRVRLRQGTDIHSYASCYVEMASKGLYSFDSIAGRVRPGGYFLVAAPSTPRTVSDLPEGIQTILSRTRYPGVLLGSSEIGQAWAETT